MRRRHSHSGGWSASLDQVRSKSENIHIRKERTQSGSGCTDEKSSMAESERSLQTHEERGLCFRCDHRAQYLEDGEKPRLECGLIRTTKMACYMYQPVKPVMLSKLDDDDSRLRFRGPMFSSRERYAGIPNMELAATIDGELVTLYWVPRQVEES